jgi:RND superfamily putative drug exporter
MTTVTGRAEIARQVSKQAEEDLRRSETLTAPIIFLALIAVFGGVVAALLPLSVGVLAVVGTLVILTILVSLTEVSVFSMNLTTGLGFGLAIDYSLFIVSRYREELAAGASTNVAVGRTMQTAGRTVAFSAGTVMISLLALLLFPVTYLRSFAYAGVAVVFLAAIASVIVLPAILAVLGVRVEALRVFKVKPPGEDGFWGHQAARVMRHPIPYAVGVSAVLVVLAIPFLNFNPGLIDDRVVPDSVSSRAATDQVRKNFASREADALQVLRRASLRPAHAPDGWRRSRCSRGVPGRRGMLLPAGHERHRRGRATAERPRRPLPPGPWHQGNLDLGGAVDRAALRRGRTTGEGHPRPPRAVRVHRRRDVGGPRRHEEVGPRSAAVDARTHRAGDVRAPLPHDRQPARTGQGVAPQRPEPHGDVRRDGVDIPGGPFSDPRLHPDGHHRRVHADPAFGIAPGSMDYEVFPVADQEVRPRP